MKKESCVISFSGGQDSVCVAGWAKNRFKKVIGICFIYGQKHSVEIEQAEKIAKKLNIEFHKIDISFFGDIVDSALTSNGNVNKPHPRNKDLPASWVPNRNGMFMTIIHSFAQKVGADTIAMGVNSSDYSGYPDCRPEFINLQIKALNSGSGCDINIETPLMYLSKADTFKMAEDEGVLDITISDSHTCYNGDRSQMLPSGRGCGNCPACKLRERGYREYLLKYKKTSSL